MKLPDAKNDSWITTVEDDARTAEGDARTAEISGQTDLSDFSLVTMPMVSAVRRRVGRGSANSDNQVEAVLKGAERCVVQKPDGWKTPAELAQPARSNPRGGPGPRGYPGGGFPGGGPPSVGRGSGQTPPPYSTLPINLSRPHEEIGVIVGSYTAIRSEDDLIAGTFSETGAKLLLVHPGQNELTPLQAGGTFRRWIRDGALVRYELRLAGTLAVEPPGRRRDVEVHQKSTTALQAVDTRKFDVPEEARKKLGGCALRGRPPIAPHRGPPHPRRSTLRLRRNPRPPPRDRDGSAPPAPPVPPQGSARKTLPA